MSVCRQCAITCNVGHAFSFVLVYQKMKSMSEEVASGDEERDWESVSAEKGYWATLYTNLEVLVHLSNVVGQDMLGVLPSVPFFDLPEDLTDKDTVSSHLVHLHFKFFDKGWNLYCDSYILI